MSAQSAIDPAPLVGRMRALLQGGRFGAARPVLSAVRRLLPLCCEVDELEARLLLGEKRLPEALALLDRSLERAPGAVALLLCRAEVRLGGNDAQAAARDAAEAVVLDAANARAKAVLGIVLSDLDQLDDAIICLAEAVRAEPDCSAFRLGLSTAQERAGDRVTAAATLRDGIARQPGDVALRTAAVMTAMRRRDFAGAAMLAEAARREGVADACVFGLLGHALSNLGRHEEATAAYCEAGRLAPEDPYVRHLVRAAGGLPSDRRAPAAYVETLFDGYAERFEQHLIGLGYRVPGLMRAQLLGRGELGPVLDLGCGTGLIGVVLSDLACHPLVGVDLSGRMLAAAGEKQIYDELIQADIETVLGDPRRCWRTVLAADVLCYFGALEAVLGAVAARLEIGGRLLFSVEVLCDGDGASDWLLRGQGRYAHTRDYVERCLVGAGLRIGAIRAEVLRQEGGRDVDGLLIVAERVCDDG